MKKYTIDELREIADDSMDVGIGDCQICAEMASGYVYVCSECLKGIIDELIEFRESRKQLAS